MNQLKSMISKNLIWAFNVNGLMEIKAIAKAANDHNKPVIMLVSQNAVNFTGLDYLTQMVNITKKSSRKPIFLQLDHALNESLIFESAKKGFDIIMIDAPPMSYKQNINYVKRISKQLKNIRKNILVEGELPVITDKSDKNRPYKNRYTNPKRVNEYLSKTAVDLLAVWAGNIHGFTRPKPPLERERLAKIYQESSIPLVLHGGDWISHSDLKFAAKNGVRKINIGPELRIAAGETIKNSLISSNFDVTDYRKLISRIINSMYEVVSKKFQIL